MADHADHLTNRSGLSIDAPTHELTDFFVFQTEADNGAGARINLMSAFDPTFPKGEDEVVWSENLTWRVNIDLGSTVDFGDESLNAVAGGYIPDPADIHKDIVLQITFKNNKPKLDIFGSISQPHKNMIKNNIDIFAGVRAEQFQFSPLVRRNRPSIALSIDKNALFNGDSDPTLLTWAQSVVEEDATYIDSMGKTMEAKDGPYIDTAGRALRSQFPVDQRVINYLDPSEQVEAGFVYPDVVIFDTSKPATFPNGRALTDDVLTYLGNLSGTSPGTTPFIDPQMGTAGPNANTGVEFAVGAESTFPDVGGIPYVDPGATSSDIRTWNLFPYLGLPYNINRDSLDNKEPVQRFYDKVTGSYYYTSNANDIEYWEDKKKVVDEGVVFVSTRDGKGVHRFFNQQDKTYFWTASETEYEAFREKSMYTYQGETFFAQGPDSATPGDTEVYRLYNSDSNRYFWSSDGWEITRFMDKGYEDQVLAWSV